MDPNLKLILEEIQQSKVDIARRFDEHEAKWELCFSEIDAAGRACAEAVDIRVSNLEAACGELQQLRVEQVYDERDARVEALQAATTELGQWRPTLEGAVDDLTLKVQKMAKHYDRLVFDSATHQPGVFTSPSSASATLTALPGADSPTGPNVATTTRGIGSGVQPPWTHIPASDQSLKDGHHFGEISASLRGPFYLEV